jgi:hypothetical protein
MLGSNFRCYLIRLPQYAPSSNVLACDECLRDTVRFWKQYLGKYQPSKVTEEKKKKSG